VPFVPPLPNHLDKLDNKNNNWEQFHTNAALLKPTKHCHSFKRALQGHEKAIWKSGPGYFVVVSG